MGADTSVFLWINHLAGHVRVIDEFFKGVANDYFPLVFSCLILVWMWFGNRDKEQRVRNQKTVFIAMIYIGITGAFMGVINHYYFRMRPFDVLPPDQVNLIFYMPTDSSFPSNMAAVIFSLATAVMIRHRKYGTILMVLAVLVIFGRVYMGVHYPLDVLAGAALGALTAGLCWAAAVFVLPWLMNLLLWIFRFFTIA